MDAIMIGSGNTATVLGKLLVQKGIRVKQVWSRNPEHGLALADQLNAQSIDSFAQLTTEADLCILAVADQAIESIAAQLKLKRKVLVHTAGSVSMDVLKGASPNYGILYPLQSLRKELDELPEIPFLIDGNSDEVKTFLEDVALQLSGKASFANDEQRFNLHLGAVIVSNFTNHLYAITEQFCKDQQVSFSLLHPLIKEVAQRLQFDSAYHMQTGPASRGDIATIHKHLQLLEQNPQLQRLYQTLSDSILQMYHKKDELRS